jgi:hypothetical protein
MTLDEETTMSKLTDLTADELEVFIATAREAALQASRAARAMPVDDPRRPGMAAVAAGLAQARDGWKALRSALYPPADGVVVQLRRVR